MYFSDVSDFIYMSGHGFYVWLAYGFSVSWLCYLLLSPLRKKRHLLKIIRTQQQIENSRYRSR